jgi:cytochrome c biogenesis protein CcmG/thiol:disulfide interchange protein DsbE
MSENVDLLQQIDPQPEPQALPPKRGLSIGSVVLLIGVALTVLVFGIALVRQQQGQPTQGPAPNFTLTTLDGKEFTLSEHRGKVVVINFWASWCGPCRNEAPAFESLWQRYKDEDVVFLGITYADNPADSRAFIEEYGMTYPVAEDGRSEVSKALYHIQGVPETFVIDKEGNIHRFFYFLEDERTATTTGTDGDDPTVPVTTAELARVIDGLLAES